MNTFKGNKSDIEQERYFKDGVEGDLADAIRHGILVSILARKLSKELGKTENFCNDLAIAGLLHDIGKDRKSVV